MTQNDRLSVSALQTLVLKRHEIDPFMKTDMIQKQRSSTPTSTEHQNNQPKLVTEDKTNLIQCLIIISYP